MMEKFKYNLDAASSKKYTHKNYNQNKKKKGEFSTYKLDAQKMLVKKY